MDSTNENPHKIYIKSNTVTVMRFLVFLSVVLMVLVAGLCVFVVFGRDDTNNYHWDQDGQFYYTLQDDVVTVEKFVDADAEIYAIPTTVNYGGKNYPVAVLGSNAFTNHRKLTTVTIPDSVTKIMGDTAQEKGAFAGCTALTTVNMGQNVGSIGAYAFKNCLALKSIQLPASVQFVQNLAFQNCLSLASIQLDSNGVLSTDCFENCLQVTTLQLADDVCLADNTRQALAKLTKLNQFVITPNHASYQVVTDAQGSCLLTTSNRANDTIVLAGSGATVPAGVTQILDWAWGERVTKDLLIPSSVTDVAVHAFGDMVIYTDAAVKPTGWLTTVPVRTMARYVTFLATEEKTAQAYIYRENGEDVYPQYEDLFADVATATAFLKWGDLTDGKVTAIYQSANLADSTAVESLKSAIEQAETYFYDADLRLQLTLNFWEEFKTAYDTAKAIDVHTAYAYLVQAATKQLTAVNAQIAAVLAGTGNAAILESTDWRVGLQNLVTAIDELNQTDMATSSKDNFQEIKTMAKTATNYLIPNAEIDEETGKLVWRNLREKYENLVTDSRQLNTVIANCQALDQDDYTAASWQNLQTHLRQAQQITTHSLSISHVRRALEQAYVDLREIDLTEHWLHLQTWLSVCDDLAIDDYQKQEYDRLMINVATVRANAEQLVTNDKVDTMAGNLRNLYQNLVEVDHASAYRTGTGILNKNSLPYFIIAVVLFTGAVACGAGAAALKYQLRQS